jgi:hypothetical protein
VSTDQRQDVKELVGGVGQGPEVAAGLESFATSGSTDLYSYIPISPSLARAGSRPASSGQFTDGESNVWDYTLEPDDSGTATTTYLNGVDTTTERASLNWSAVTTDPYNQNVLLWSYNYSAWDGSAFAFNYRFTTSGDAVVDISVSGTATWIDPDTRVIYTVTSFTMDLPTGGGFSMTMDVEGDDNTSLHAEFAFSSDATQMTVLVSFTDSAGYVFTANYTFDFVASTIEYAFYDSVGYSGRLVINSDFSGDGCVKDPDGHQIATITIAAGGSPITVTYRDGTSEVIGGSVARSAKMLKRR